MFDIKKNLLQGSPFFAVYYLVWRDKHIKLCCSISIINLLLFVLCHTLQVNYALIVLTGSPDLYQYDVFISHAQDTDDYVSTVLKKGLMRKGYRVQTPAEFVAGCASNDNIINAFMITRYVMILFSATYDHNCSELQFAYNKVDDTHYNCLIPIKCGGVIPTKLQRITYADWDDDDVVSRVEQTIGMCLVDVYMLYVIICLYR